MANYHKRNSIRAVQWDPENAQIRRSFLDGRHFLLVRLCEWHRIVTVR